MSSRGGERVPSTPAPLEHPCLGGNRMIPSQRHSWLVKPWDGSSGAGGGMWLSLGCAALGRAGRVTPLGSSPGGGGGPVPGPQPLLKC